MTQGMLLGALLVSGLATEVRFRKFYNVQAVAFVAAGLALAAWSGGRPGFVSAAWGVGAAFAATAPLFAVGWIGGGDVKLACAVGAAAAFPAILAVLLWTAVSGGVLALLFAARAGRLGETLSRVGLVFVFLARFSRFPPDAGSIRVPLAPAFVLGVLLHRSVPLPLIA